MKIDGKKMRMLLDLIKESKKEDLGHLSKGLEIEDKNGTKYTITKVLKSRIDSDKSNVEGLEIKYYDVKGQKKKRRISKEEFLKLFKIDKKKSKKTIQGNKDD